MEYPSKRDLNSREVLQRVREDHVIARRETPLGEGKRYINVLDVD